MTPRARKVFDTLLRIDEWVDHVQYLVVLSFLRLGSVPALLSGLFNLWELYQPGLPEAERSEKQADAAIRIFAGVNLCGVWAYAEWPASARAAKLSTGVPTAAASYHGGSKRKKVTLARAFRGVAAGGGEAAGRSGMGKPL